MVGMNKLKIISFYAFVHFDDLKFISEFIAETAVIVDILKFSIFYFIKIKNL